MPQYNNVVEQLPFGEAEGIGCDVLTVWVVPLTQSLSSEKLCMPKKAATASAVPTAPISHLPSPPLPVGASTMVSPRHSAER
ncbi:hypothetical protein CG740_37010 [Streptomyces sp. CB01201]|nr:hypothetical protein CG740_37010 [Streptomyces sp. CB01201]